MALTLMTVAELTEHLGRQTDLPSTALERIGAAQEQLIVRRHGPHTGDVSERYVAHEDRFALNGCRTPLRRPADVVKTVTLDGTAVTGDDLPVIDTDTRWLFWDRDEYLQGIVITTYQPIDDRDIRKLMLVDLVRLEVRDVGVQTLQQTGIRQVMLNPKKRREEILARLDYWDGDWDTVWS